MAIAKKPKSNHPPAEEQRAKQFIEREPTPAEEIKVPIMMRISPSLLKRVDPATTPGNVSPDLPIRLSVNSRSVTSGTAAMAHS